MGMERLPGPVGIDVCPVAIDDGTNGRWSSNAAAILFQPPADAAALFRLHKTVESGAPACWDWRELAEMRSVAKALLPAGYLGVPRETLIHSLYGAVVASAAERHLDVREVGKNAGEDVEEMLEAVGRKAGDAWCAAFAAQMHRLAATWLGGLTTCPQEAAVQLMWGSARAASVKTFTKDDVHGGTERPRAGDVFIMAKAGAYDRLTAMTKRLWDSAITSTHAGLVVGYDAGSFTVTTIEGNTDPGGGREGDGVYLRERVIKKSPTSGAAILGFVRPTIIM